MVRTLSTSDKNLDTNRFMAAANDTSDWMFAMIVKYVMIAYAVNMITISFSVYFVRWFFNRNPDVNELYHPLNLL